MEKEETKKETVKKTVKKASEKVVKNAKGVKNAALKEVEDVKAAIDNVINPDKEIEPLVTCRVLFISVLDKIYLVTLILMFISFTISNFSGDISSANYGFWGRVGGEILIVIFMVIAYLFFNWLYKCVAKTMLCVTRHQVYKEAYVPFKRSETSIPLDKITAVTTFNFFWIFRSVIVHQYHRFPLVFFTWNNQEFKDKVNELITTERGKIKNSYATKNIINDYGILKYIAVALAGIICLLGAVRFFNWAFGVERRIPGTYVNNERRVVLSKDGSCDISGIVSGTTYCSWEYDKDDKEVNIKYSRYSYYYGYDRLHLTYKKNTLTYNDTVYKKR